MDRSRFDVAISKSCHFVNSLDNFFRIYCVGFAIQVIFVGALLSAPNLSGAMVLSIFVIAISFHIFSCVLNDIIDLPIDSTNPLRKDDPLVCGEIRPVYAILLVLVQVPLCLYLINQINPLLVAPKYLFILSVILMTTYNFFGKRWKNPIFTDVVQSLSWSCLSLLGGLLSDGVSVLTIIGAVYFGIYMMLVNGVHGGIRDLQNDLAWKKYNTSILWGVISIGDDKFLFNNKIRCYAFFLHFILISLVFIGCWYLPDKYTFSIFTLLVGISFASLVILGSLLRTGVRFNYKLNSFHSFFLLLPVLLLLVPYLDVRHLVWLLFLYLSPFLFSYVGRDLVFYLLKLIYEPKVVRDS